ncbi:hypothetical protein G9A89_017859 [Geosiphon pyriformis]|nr:hypothetical protein G9A89_017859 [Geosiphon pyriformis]
MSHCCCCIRLKPAVVIITLLTMVNSLYNAITGIIAFTNRNESSKYFFHYVPTFALIFGISNVIITLGAIYGLFVVSFANIYRLIRPYVIFFYINVAINFILGIVDIILNITPKSKFIESCEVNHKVDYCNDDYNAELRKSIVTFVLVIIILIYFALVIAAYATHRYEKEERIVEYKENEVVTNP